MLNYELRVNQILSSAFQFDVKRLFGVIYSNKCHFHRQRSGFLGWGGDKSEIINGYESKLYSVSGVEIITRTRTEHMTAEDRERFKG